MKTLALAIALFAVSPAVAFATVPPAAAQQNPSSLPPGAQAAEAVLRTLMAAATGPASAMDYTMMTPAVADAVRDYPEGGDEVRAFGVATGLQFLGSPPGGYLFRITYPAVEIDFFLALNDEGKISAMYFHPVST